MSAPSSKAQRLAELSGKMAQQAQGADAAPGGPESEARGGGKRADDNVVDADFEEVKDDK